MNAERRPQRIDPDERPSEDDLATAALGPRGVSAPDPARMTPAREKKTPKRDGSPEHTA